MVVRLFLVQWRNIDLMESYELHVVGITGREIKLKKKMKTKIILIFLLLIYT